MNYVLLAPALVISRLLAIELLRGGRPADLIVASALSFLGAAVAAVGIGDTGSLAGGWIIAVAVLMTAAPLVLIARMRCIRERQAKLQIRHPKVELCVQAAILCLAALALLSPLMA